MSGAEYALHVLILNFRPTGITTGAAMAALPICCGPAPSAGNAYGASAGRKIPLRSGSRLPPLGKAALAAGSGWMRGSGAPSARSAPSAASVTKGHDRCQGNARRDQPVTSATITVARIGRPVPEIGQVSVTAADDADGADANAALRGVTTGCDRDLFPMARPPSAARPSFPRRRRAFGSRRDRPPPCCSERRQCRC
jgi:hypothetical protein